MRHAWLLLLVLALAALPLACSSDDDDDNDDSASGDTDTDTDTDADGDADGDADFEECVPGAGEGGTGTAFAGSGNDGDVVEWVWLDDADNPTAEIDVESWADWDGPDEPGTYPVTDVEASYETCGVCVLVYTADSVFMPVPGSGDIVIDAITMGEAGVGQPFTGSFDIELQEVTIEDDTLVTTPVDGGCTGRLSYSWDGVAEAFPEE